MESLFFGSWQSTLRTVIITILAYAALVMLLRSFGKRSLSKMNAFDFIITVALGSTLATVSLNKSVALLDGVLAFFLLLGLQYTITWLAVRIKAVKGWVTSTPALLFYKGQLLHRVLKKERITIEEVYAKAREQGFSSLNDVGAIVLETTGDMTVIGRVNEDERTTLQSVRHYESSNG